MAKNDNQVLKVILNFLQQTAVKQGIFILLVGAAVAAGFMVYDEFKDSDMKPLDYHFNDRSIGVIVDTLEKSRIKYKIDTVNSIIYVPISDYQRAKIKLSSAGIQKDDTVNFSYLSDASTLGESQFIENARYMRALETDLSKTINSIEGISSSKVHIAIPHSNTFADENEKVSASVFITSGEGMMVDKEKVKSIIQLVASSVPGLDPKLVSVTDQYGHFLSDAITDNARISTEQMIYKNNLQKYYERRIESVLAPIAGKGKVNVKVNADIDFTELERAKEEYDPQQKVVRSEQSTTEEIGSTSASGAAGALANSPPSGGQSGGGKSSSSQGRQQSIKNYELGKSVTYQKSSNANIKNISVAVVVDNERVINKDTKEEEIKPLNKEKIEQITSLVKSTIGFKQDRGDVVTVVNAGFNLQTEGMSAEKPALWEKPFFYTLIKQVGEVLVALILFVVMYRKLSKHLADIKKQGPSGNGGGSGGGLALTNEGLSQEMLDLKNEQIDRLKQLSTSDPGRVAVVLKGWMKK